MQPVVYSTVEGVWRRCGEGVYYYKNRYTKPQQQTQQQNQPQQNQQQQQTYATLTFTLTFRFPDDTLHVAYHYPYTFSDLQ
ncbi:hypothetical protein HK104_007999, partial [Borealophlyctis nickersoniae]